MSLQVEAWLAGQHSGLCGVLHGCLRERRTRQSVEGCCGGSRDTQQTHTHARK